MSVAHTPGRWEVIERLSDLQSGTDLYVGIPDRREEKGDYSLRYAEEHVAQVFGGALREANAHPIAAAPDLLEALRGLLPQWSTQEQDTASSIRHWEYERSQGNYHAGRVLAAYAAIVKAEGRMTPQSIAYQVDAWLQYSRKGGSRGLTFWLDSKGFTREERRLIMLALSDGIVR